MKKKIVLIDADSATNGSDIKISKNGNVTSFTSELTNYVSATTVTNSPSELLSNIDSYVSGGGEEQTLPITGLEPNLIYCTPYIPGEPQTYGENITITIIDSEFNNGEYIAQSTFDAGDVVYIEIEGELPNYEDVSGSVILTAQTGSDYILADNDIGLSKGDTFQIIGSTFNNGTYLYNSSEYDGDTGKYKIFVQSGSFNNSGDMGSIYSVPTLNNIVVAHNLNSEFIEVTVQIDGEKYRETDEIFSYDINSLNQITINTSTGVYFEGCLVRINIQKLG